MSNFTLFTSDASSATSGNAFDQDAFQDITLSASNNTSLTSNSNTNPLGDLFANNDTPRFGVKTLLIQDLVLETNRASWINNKPTYRIIWNQSYPSVSGYVFGDINFLIKNGRPVVNFKAVGDGIAISGVIRKVAWIVNGNTAATSTAQLAGDQVNTTTIDFSNINSDSDSQNVAKFAAYLHSGSNATQDLHNYQLTALQANTLTVGGVLVYFENAGANIECAPGVTYNNKTQISTSVGATLPLPSYGSTLGGNALIYKSPQSTYVASALSASTVISTATGSSGTNLVTVITGQGASFMAGYGLIAGSGATMYVGSILSVSTDTFTMSATLGFGLSNTIYRSWISSPTLAINSSLMRLTSCLDFNRINYFSNIILDPNQNYALWGSNLGVTLVDSFPAALFLGASGFLQCEGDFSAAEIETSGNGIFDFKVNVQGTFGWTLQIGQTGAVRRTLFTEGGPGWHSFQMIPGASLGILGINRINLYKRQRDLGITFGALASFETLEGFARRFPVNATLMSVGAAKRIYADQLFLQGAWSRGFTTGAAGGVLYYGTSTNSLLRLQYYGSNIALIGTPGGGTLTLNGLGVGLTFGYMNAPASEGFNTLQYTVGSGATAIIEAVEYTKSQGEMTSLANYKSAGPQAKSGPSELFVTNGNGHGSLGAIRRYSNVRRQRGWAITYSDSAVSGAAFLINESGLYAMTITDTFSGAPSAVGISRNSSQLNLAIGSIHTEDLIGYETAQAGFPTSMSSIWFLEAGDIIRPHTDGTPDSTTPNGSYFKINQLSKV